MHIVYISVIGADTVPLGCFQAELGAERAIEESGAAWTTLRAAQFHGLVLTMAEKMAKMPVVPVPGGIRFQPVDSREVAAWLVELVLGEPAGLVADLAGPKVYGMGDLNRTYLRARGKHRLMMPVRVPGKAGRPLPGRGQPLPRQRRRGDADLGGLPGGEGRVRKAWTLTPPAAARPATPAPAESPAATC